MRALAYVCVGLAAGLALPALAAGAIILGASLLDLITR